MSSENTYFCQFCNKQCKNKNSISNHERLCKQNPNRQISHFEKISYEERQEMRKHGNRKNKNGYTKAKELGLPPPMLSEEAKQKLANKNRTRIWKNESREKLSDSMRKSAKENPGSYSSSNRGRTKEIEKYGIKFQGSWELKFYEFCIENRIECLRNYQGFPYIWNGDRTYYPDFYLPESNIYVEIKGYKVERDVAKWSYFPKKLIVIQKREMTLIQKNLFKINDLY